MNAPEPAVHAAWQMIPLAQITPSPTNPRKRFNQATLDELIESVRRHGVIQPVLVRPTKADRYELVAGERRYRAATAAGLTAIPASVRVLTDVEALELQVVENLQREDLHPLEEAEGYELLQQKHSYSVEDLAAKVGKSKAYVYARLKLTALTPKGRDAFYAGKLNPSTALLIARIPVPKLQDQALAEITQVGYQGEPHYSVRAATQHLQTHYMLRLADAPFAPSDAKLLPKAGACSACPKRTGNQPELFGDVKGADVCTDPECFAAKRTAHNDVIRAAAEAKGQKVISGKEAKKILPYDNRVAGESAYIGLDDKNYNDPKNRTYRQLLGKAAPATTLVESPTGNLVEVVAKKDVAGILKEKLPQRNAGNDDQKKREAKARLETSIRARLFEAIVAKHPGTMTPADAALIAGELFDRADHEHVKRIVQLWEPEAYAKKPKDRLHELRPAFSKRIETMQPAELCLLMVELALVPEIHVGAYSRLDAKPARLLAVAARLDIDAAGIRRELTVANAAKTKPKPAKSKAKSKPSPAKTSAPKKPAIQPAA